MSLLRQRATSDGSNDASKNSDVPDPTPWESRMAFVEQEAQEAYERSILLDNLASSTQLMDEEDAINWSKNRRLKTGRKLRPLLLTEQELQKAYNLMAKDSEHAQFFGDPKIKNLDRSFLLEYFQNVRNQGLPILIAYKSSRDHQKNDRGPQTPQPSQPQSRDDEIVGIAWASHASGGAETSHKLEVYANIACEQRTEGNWTEEALMDKLLEMLDVSHTRQTDFTWSQLGKQDEKVSGEPWGWARVCRICVPTIASNPGAAYGKYSRKHKSVLERHGFEERMHEPEDMIGGEML